MQQLFDCMSETIQNLPLAHQLTNVHECPDNRACGQCKRTNTSCSCEDIIFDALFKQKSQFLCSFIQNLLSLCKYNWHAINFPSPIPAYPTWVPNSPTLNSTLVCIFIRKGKSSREKPNCLALTGPFSQERLRLKQIFVIPSKALLSSFVALVHCWWKKRTKYSPCL